MNMNVMWVLFCVALTGAQLGYGLPLGTPNTYPQDEGGIRNVVPEWNPDVLYAALPGMVFIVVIVVVIYGCTWCYRHKDCKNNNQGNDNQLFTASVSQLHDAGRRAQPDSGFSEPANNNISEDNNNGPISLREMQNIANNNAAAYIVSENEERNRMSRESVVEFEPLPDIGVPDPLERFADWFGNEDFPRNRLQYLREIGRGWFGRIVEGEVEGEQASTVAVKILNQNASLEDKARFLQEARMYRDLHHENILAFIAKCLQEDPWILVFELCPMDLQQYLEVNRPNMAALMEGGVPLRLVCDVTSGLSYLHSRGFLYGNLRAENVLVRGDGAEARAVLGRYGEDNQHTVYSAEADVYSLGVLLWEAWSWEGATAAPPLPEPATPCLYRDHMYQVMQLCWNANPEARPSSAQVHALIHHLYITHERANETSRDDGYGSSDFEERWQRLKPNSIPVVDEHVALVHAPSTSAAHYHDPTRLAAGPASRSSSIMSDRAPLAEQTKSESMNNLHGSLDDVRNIYLVHNEAAALECHQANLERHQDLSDSSVDPWLKDLIAGSQDDVSYYKDVSDVIKNLDNILNSEKTSSSESSHQASPSRDNLSLDCKRENPVQSGLVKSPGIRNFQNLESDFMDEEPCDEDELDEPDEADRDTVGTLSHSFERATLSAAASQHTLANLTPDTPNKDIELVSELVVPADEQMPKDNVVSDSAPANVCLDVSEDVESEVTEDCQKCDNVEVTTYHLGLEPLVTKSADEVTSERETDRSSAGVTEIPEETKMDSQGNYVVDMESLDGTVSAELPLLTQSEKLPETNLQIESHIPDNIKSLTAAFLQDELKHASSQVEDRINDNMTHEAVNEHVVEDLEVNHNDRPELTDVIRESEKIVDSVISAATDALTPKKIEQTCSNGIDHELEDVPVPVVDMIHVEDNSTKDESTLVETINEVTDIKESNESHSPFVNPNIHLSPSRFRDDDVTDVSESIEERSDTASTLPIGGVPDVVQTSQFVTDDIEDKTILPNRIPNESTIYMDLIDTTAVEINKEDTMSNTVKEVINTCLDNAPADEPECTLVREDSTVYMDLPSVLNETHNFLHTERAAHFDAPAFTDLTASTPKNEQEGKAEQKVNSERCITPDYGPGVSLTRLEQKSVPDNVSPFDSPTRSHPTETYDENSSIVLGPFENCSLEFFKAVKSGPADLEIPKEEMLAFSSNFSEMNLATPSPLRDVNFLNEVPDIEVNEAREDSVTDTEQKNQLDFCESESKSEHGPSTPPNSPGNFLASQKYSESPIVQPEAAASGVSSSQEEIDLNQIELQITSKLAMAENENNMNIEYSGPLSEAGADDVPEAYLAGSGALALALDAACMRALRDELELKLPLAQVASIEPAEELESSEPSEDLSGEVWRAPETIVCYVGALSPIAEETGGQLSAYDNDVAWNASTRTDSSSYLEPCNNSTDEFTDLPTGPSAPTAQSPARSPRSPHSPARSPRSPDSPARSPNDTYTVRSHHTYTVNEAPSKQATDISADSLNSVPKADDAASPLDHTYNVDDKQCEVISQVSPFMLSPSEETTAASTFSKPTVPTDAKSSKPSETQCLSKATSIDSWCSNDTLFNVEEDFDDLADVAEYKDDDKSDSTHTLNDKESTYIVHDEDKSDCDSFTPDSITANQTYTKPKLEETPIVVLSDVNNSNSPANTPTRDLAYGTLVSGLTSCATELMSTNDEMWRLQQPELVRRSPIADDTLIITPPKEGSKNQIEEPSPKLQQEPMIRKMDSVEITCLQDNSHDSVVEHKAISEEPEDVPQEPHVAEAPQVVTENTNTIASNSPDFHFKNMANSIQSTPLVEAVDESAEEVPSPMTLPERRDENAASPFINVPNFQVFINSAELRPQDISPVQQNAASQDTGLLLEAESQTSHNDLLFDRTPNFGSFERSAVLKPQEVNSRSNHDLSAVSPNDDFRQFENSVRSRPQDLSAIEATSILLQSEIKSSSLALGSSTNLEFDYTSQNYTQNGLSSTNLGEYRLLSPNILDIESEYDENEQPHSIIITDIPLTPSVNRTYDSHANGENITFDSHTHRNHSTSEIRDRDQSPPVNGDMNSEHSHSADRSPNDVQSPKNVRSPGDDPQSPNEGTSPNKDVESQKDEIKSPKDTVLILSENVEIPNDNILSPKQDVLGPKEDDQSPKDSVLSPSEDVQILIDLQSHDGHVQDVTAPQLPNGSHVENNAYFGTVNFINESFEELLESNVDSSHSEVPPSPKEEVKPLNLEPQTPVTQQNGHAPGRPIENGVKESKSATESFLTNEKMFCQTEGYSIPLLGDIRFTGPASEIMSTSFSQESPTEVGPKGPEGTEQPVNGAAADILKEWDSDSDDSHDTNSSSGEFIWKDGAGHETPVVPSYFDHQRDANQQPRGQGSAGGSEASGDSGSGSEGDEVEFVPSSWDCRAAPAKSSLRSLEQAQPVAGPEGKKRVVFKRQKYHCVYEYPREVAAAEEPREADYCTYAEWDAASAEEAELGYQQLYGMPLDGFLRAPVAAGSDYDDDFFISSSARPFESLGLSSQFFPGLHALKAGVIDRPSFDTDPESTPSGITSGVYPDFPPPSPLTPNTLDLITPDSGVEDITPGSTAEFEKKLPEELAASCWRSVDSPSSSESTSPGSPSEALGGLRHTRDKLKLDLPPSPHIPSPRIGKVFNFSLEKPKPRESTTPLVMTDETPVVAPLPLPKDTEDLPLPEPTFSTFGKPVIRADAEPKAIILDEEAEVTVKPTESREGTVLDSGDEDSGIESSAKASLERKQPHVS